MAVSVEPVRVDLPVGRSVDKRKQAVTGPVVLCQGLELMFLCEMVIQPAQQRTANAAQQWSKCAGRLLSVVNLGRRHDEECKQQCCHLQLMNMDSSVR